MKIFFAIVVILLVGFTQSATAAMVRYSGADILAGYNSTTCDATGSADSTACIQAAIDYCYGQTACQTTFCPDGIYKTSQPIFLDAPGNLRGADGTNGPNYASGTTYAVNQTVNSGGVAYISLQNSNTGNTPASSPTFWRVFAYAGGTTYALNDVVRFNGIPWISLGSSNTGNTPAVTSTHWRPTTIPATNFQFSMNFMGNGALDSGENQRGCYLMPTYNNSLGMVVGTGSGMSVRGVQIVAPSSGYRNQQDTNGIGIGIAGGNGGTNRTLIENVGVWNFNKLFVTGFNSDGLGAETTWRKIAGGNCYQGVVIEQSQNDINDVDGPSVSCTQNFVATAGPGMSVHDGNVSTSSGQGNAFSISSTSSLTAHASGNNFNYTFTTTIASPDTYITGCGTNVGNCVYDSWVIVAPHWGPIPLTMTAYNSGTGVGTFQTWANWGDYYFYFDNATSTTDIQTDIQAATTIYATERLTTFTGNAFNIKSVHIENPSACTTFINNMSGFNADHGINVENARFNYSIGGDAWKAGTAAQLAWFYCQQSFPFIWQNASASNLRITNSYFGQSAGSDPVVIDVQYGLARCQFVAMNGQGLFNPIVRSTGVLGGWQAGGGSPIASSGLFAYTPGLGGCEWQPTPFMPSASAASQVNPPLVGSMMVPYVGYHPAPWAHPRIYGATYTTLGSITSSNALGSYPLPDGYTIYSVLDPLGNGAGKFVQSEQQFYSYGQTLNNTSMGGTISLLYKGQSYAVAADATTCTWLFPGLGITLNNGSGAVHYEVTGVFPDISIDGGTHACNFTVLNAAQDGDPIGLAGTKTSTFTPSSIGQDAYTWKTLTLQ